MILPDLVHILDGKMTPKWKMTMKKYYWGLWAEKQRGNRNQSKSYGNTGMTQTWIWQLWPKFITFFPLWILINDTNIICLSSKNTQFFKIRRVWLKNCVCHAPLKLKLQKGVADTIFEPKHPNFGKLHISWRQTNDISIIYQNS